MLIKFKVDGREFEFEYYCDGFTTEVSVIVNEVMNSDGPNDAGHIARREISIAPGLQYYVESIKGPTYMLEDI